MSSSKQRILITMGDPAGIGPEVTVKALLDRSISKLAHFQVIGDFTVIDRVRKSLRVKPEISLLDLANVSTTNFAFGIQRPAFGKASMEYIDEALKLLKAGAADALVTAPVNKSSIRSAGFKEFEGHTEYLAQMSGAKEFAMMFVGKHLKITLVTRHIALKDVARTITEDMIFKTISITHEHLKKYFGIEEPRIAVAGLNPHASDSGLFGDEEARLIIPAIKKASITIKNIYGPLSADAVFYETLKGKFDAVVAMYHDQALAPFKTLYFNDGVNLTLGLPFIRTSPDHGTAFDIAGKSIADPTSMKEAIRLACSLKPS
ncbi:MAG: 4-hydroxythreonine-4-phosphate dehydrogenase PdxA [Candidatus Omnitrophica bacterium]|nr:4-hydroxythreonine-4-phosphate dehydrogenase PdxA [Candidatus Omnitrophota bacterium]